MIDKNWKRLGTAKPKDGQCVVVFRSLKRKKIVGTFKIIPEYFPVERMGEYFWVTEYGSCHTPNIEDLWLELPEIEITEKKKY